MEADSTTYDTSSKTETEEPRFPFPVCPGNFKLYKDVTHDNGEKRLECQIVERLQNFGLLPKSIKCPTSMPECKFLSRPARVIDRVQWVCENCSKRQPIRTGSFFLRLQCSILQALQVILAWCEDAECSTVVEHFGVKPRVVNTIYNKLDELAVKKHSNLQLGGQNSVVLAEMYPDCLNRLSPDTTDQPHVHRILMLADTNHIPTHYELHIVRENFKKNGDSNSGTLESLKTEVEQVLARMTLPDSTIVIGNNMPTVAGAATIQQLVQYCDVDMQHFLTNRIWRQAMTLCAASRELCAGAATATCARAVQRYLHTSLYRLRRASALYEHVLTTLADDYTENCDDYINTCDTGAQTCDTVVDTCDAGADTCDASADTCDASADTCNTGVDPCNTGIVPCEIRADPCNKYDRSATVAMCE